MWEQVSQETAQWSLLIGKLDDIAALSSILSFHPIRPKTSTADVAILDYTIPDISLMTILHGGNGIVSDLVAKWIASTGIKPSTLFQPAEQEEATEHFTPNPATSYLDLLRSHFPFSLQSGILLCHLTWEYANAWSKNLTKFEYLRASVEYLSLFDKEDFALKHSICCHIWNVLLNRYIKISMKLLNSSGKGLEDLREQTNFTDVLVGFSIRIIHFEFNYHLAFFILSCINCHVIFLQIPDFVNQCIHYINHMTDSISSPAVDIKAEEIFPDGASLSLAAKANKQSCAKAELLDLHLQLMDVLLIVSTLNVKIKRPIQSLFIEVSRDFLAYDINAELTESFRRSDDTVDKARRKFLHRTINGAVALIRKDFQTIFMDDFDMWIEKVMTLGDKWSLDTNDLLKYQVTELLIRGWDDCAEAKWEKVIQPATMGQIFLAIAGDRLYTFIRDRPDLKIRVALIGTRMSSYLDTLVRFSGHFHVAFPFQPKI